MKILLVLLSICQFVSCTVKGDRINNGSLTEGETLVVKYCDCKLRQKSEEKYTAFNITRCLQKKKDNCLHIKDINKRCRHFKKIVNKVCGTPENSKQLNITKYRVCGSRKKYTLFDTKRSICCNGTVIKSHAGENQCCGQNIKNTSEVICCHGKRYQRKSLTEKCCGENVYNTSTHFCFQDQMHKGNGSSISNTSFVQEYDVNDSSTELQIKDETTNVLEAKSQLNGKSIAIISSVLALIVIVMIASGAIYYGYRRKRRYLDKDKMLVSNQPMISTNNCSRFNLRITDVRTKFMSETNQQVGTCDDCCRSSNQDANTIVRLDEPATTSSPPANEMASSVTAEVHSRVSLSTKTVNDNSTKRHSRSSLYSTITLNMSDYVKDFMKNGTEIKQENFVQNLMKESSTQTCGPKETNRRDLFGKPFQLSCFVTKENPTVKIEHSDAKMTISARDLKHQNIEVLSSTHTSLQEVRQKLDIKDEYHIISACMEYDLPAVETLKDYALIELKLAGRLSDQLNIWRMVTDKHGKSMHYTFEVPIVSSHQRNVDTYCILKNNKAFIYTKVFSTYVCTKHNGGSEREIDLWGVLYAKLSSDPIRATIILYIVDALYIEIQDYKSELDQSEQLYGGHRRGHDRIILPEKVTDKDKLEIELSIHEPDKWDFIRDRRYTDIVYDIFERSICDISCQQKSIDSCKCAWQMSNKTDMKPEMFIGHLYVKTENQQKRRAVFTVDEQVTQKTDQHLNFVRREISKSPLNSIDNNKDPHKELNTLDSTNSYKPLEAYETPLESEFLYQK